MYDLVGNPEDRSSRDAARLQAWSHLLLSLLLLHAYFSPGNSIFDLSLKMNAPHINLIYFKRDLMKNVECLAQDLHQTCSSFKR